MKSWCKVASNLDSHPRIRRAGRAGREVFLFALRRNAEPDNPVPGRLPGVMLESWYLADQLMMSEDDAVTGVTACRHAGLLIEDGESWVICGWDEDWGKTSVPGKDRTAKWREGKKSQAPVTSVTSPNVTQRHGDAGDALDKTRSEEKRVEEKRREKRERVAASRRATAIPDGWVPARTPANEAAEAETKAIGVDLRAELLKLRDWSLAGGKTCKDWDARWRGWIRRAADDIRRSRGPQHGGAVSQALLDMAMGDT